MPLHSVDGVTYHDHQPHPYAYQYRYRYQSRPRPGMLRVLNPSESTRSLALSPRHSPSPSHSASVSDSGCVLSSSAFSPSPSRSSSPSSPVPSQRRVRQDDIEDLSEKIRRRRRAFVDAVTLAIAEGRDPYTQPYRYSSERERDVQEQRQDQQRYPDVPRQAQDTHAQSSSSTLPPYELSAEQGDVVVLSPEVEPQSYASQLAVQLPQRAALPVSDLYYPQQQNCYLSTRLPSCTHPVEKNSGLSSLDAPSQERHSDRDRVWPWPSHLRSPQPQSHQNHPHLQQTKMHPKFADIRPLMIQRKQYAPDVHLHRQQRWRAPEEGEGSYDNARPYEPPHPTYPHRSLRPGHAHNPQQAPPPVPVSTPMPPPLAAAPLTRRRYPARGHGQGEVMVGCRYPDSRSYHTTRRPLPTRQQPQSRPQPHIDPYHYDHQPLSQAHPPSLRPSYQPSAQHPPSSSSVYSYSYPHSQSHPQFSSYSSTAAPTINRSRSRGASAPVVKLSVDGLSYEDDAGGGEGLGRARGDIGIPRPREHLHLGYSRPHRDGGAGRGVAAAYSGTGVVGPGSGQGQRLLVEDRQRRAYLGQAQPQAHAPATQPRHHPHLLGSNPQRREGPYSHSHSQPAAPSVNVNYHPHCPNAIVNANMISVISQQPQRHPGMQAPPRSGHSAATAWNPKGMPLAADGTREWSTDLCGFCDHNLGTCCKALWCPCIIYGRNKARIEHLYEKNAPMSEEDEMESCNADCVIHGLLSSFSLCLFGWVIQIQNRAFIRRRYAISGDWLGDCCAALCCCSACELAQESREIELEEGFRMRRRALDMR